jgi:HPt (histidine-containing phosphotransfer) domain-containing protein
MVHIDKEELLDRVDNDKELLADLVEIFVEDGLEQLNNIESAISAEDTSAVEHASHSFKGSSRNMAAVNLADIAEKLEQAGREGDLSNADKLLEELRAEYDRVVPELEGML